MSGSRFTYSFETFHFSPNWGLDVPVPRMLRAAHAAGYEAVGLDVKTVRRLGDTGTSLADLRAMVDDAGLTCSDVMPLTVGADADATVAMATELANMARALSAPTCIATVALEAADMKASALRRVFARCADLLSEVGSRLALEYLPYSPIVRIKDAADLCADVGWERAGVLVDVWHTAVTDQIAEIGGLTAEQVAFVQFDDAALPLSEDVVTESRTRRRLPGQGTMDLTGFVDAVKGVGYTGVISPEILNLQIRDACDVEGFAREVLTATKPYWE